MRWKHLSTIGGGGRTGNSGKRQAQAREGLARQERDGAASECSSSLQEDDVLVCKERGCGVRAADGGDQLGAFIVAQARGAEA